MEIRKTYKFEYTKDGKILKGISAGFLPDYAEKILSEVSILYPAKGMVLKRKSDEKTLGYVILKNDDIIDNYEEVEKEDE